MLTLKHDKEIGAPKLYICNQFAVAWIGYYRRLTLYFGHIKEIHNWRMWVQRRPELPPSKGKSPTGLLIESRLRAWLLQRFRRKLHDLCFEELLAIAEGKSPIPRQRIKLEWKKQGANAPVSTQRATLDVVGSNAKLILVFSFYIPISLICSQSY
jgi:hypothetical protein